jgi:Ubiquitin carboxyl-terminal hydrolase
MKIHDCYQFPARLKLDEFLAPASHRAFPNTYLLHSVLVHQGDVGGGHYYAYIRPGKGKPVDPESSDKVEIVGFDYQRAAERAGEEYEKAGVDPRTVVSAGSASGVGSSSSSGGGGDGDDGDMSPEAVALMQKIDQCLEAEARGGQWYKFNDESVQKVVPFEAINYCFGRQQDYRMAHFGGGSAYMLVYIRESDAAEVMRPLGDADLPEQLTQRLDDLIAQRNAEEHRITREKMYTTINYGTEEDVRNFSNYHRYADFLDDGQLKNVRIMCTSSYLRVLMTISDQLGVLPPLLRLWVCAKEKPNMALRAKRHITTSEYHKQLTGGSYFVQCFELDDQEDAVDKQRVEEFAREYERLRQSEKQWVDRLRAALEELPQNKLVNPLHLRIMRLR